MEVRDKWAKRDRMLHAVAENGNVRLVLLRATRLVQAGVQKHALNPLSSILFGELLMGALLTTASLKGQDRSQLRIDVSGPIGFGVAEATATGEVRGYLSGSDFEPRGGDRAEMLENALGIGLLKITRLSENGSTQTGSVELLKSRLPYDLSYYYLQSEQIPTAIRMNVELAEDLSVRGAAALMVQALPGADEEEIIAIENKIIDYPNLVTEFEDDESLLHSISRFLPSSFQIVGKSAVDFFCPCSHDYYATRLALLSRQDLEEMAEEGSQKLECHYCRSVYEFTPSEIQKILLRKGHG